MQLKQLCRHQNPQLAPLGMTHRLTDATTKIKATPKQARRSQRTRLLTWRNSTYNSDAVG
ncbi:MAG: hypothetical protein EAZ37_10225 [Burkholderiales bacterium]|nr:MAG: hypothetical protein EAZ37_10225 [Burkholderiales bacterium]